jgi:hypothetical protein
MYSLCAGFSVNQSPAVRTFTAEAAERAEDSPGDFLCDLGALGGDSVLGRA